MMVNVHTVSQAFTPKQAYTARINVACINIIVDAVKQDVYNHVPVERVGRSLTPAQMDSSRLQQAKESVKRITFRDASGQCDIGVKQVAFFIGTSRLMG